MAFNLLIKNKLTKYLTIHSQDIIFVLYLKNKAKYKMKIKKQNNLYETNQNSIEKQIQDTIKGIQDLDKEIEYLNKYLIKLKLQINYAKEANRYVC